MKEVIEFVIGEPLVKIVVEKFVDTYSLFVDYRVQLESLPSVYGQLSHTPKSLKRLY